MVEKLTFHFEGALADSHKMNFYESARFQYAAARLMVKLAQFRYAGRFVRNITSNSNYDIMLIDQSAGSFNINIEDAAPQSDPNNFINISLSDLIAYVSERIVEKIDRATLVGSVAVQRGGSAGRRRPNPALALDKLIADAASDSSLVSTLPAAVQDLIKRRAAELYREQRLNEHQATIARIDVARSQKLIAMSAPLLSEMATALRTSASTLEIKSTFDGHERSVLFLDRQMAQEIETAAVDEDITAILGDVTQFNKDNGWGKIKIEEGTKIVNFSVPSDILPIVRQALIDSMKTTSVYVQAYFVRDRGDEVIRLIVIGILPTPPS